MVIVFLLTGGLVALVAGGELLVRGASSLAAVVRISPLVIGLTVVAFGTSAPELAVSLQSCFAGKTDLAVGNVVGSNIFNVLFILGLSAAITPLLVSSQLVRVDVPLMIAVSVLLLVLGLDGRIGRIDGLLLFASLIVYTTWTIVQSRRESKRVQEEFREAVPHTNRPGRFHLPIQIALIIAGLVLLSVGSRWLVAGSVRIATAAGLSELVIGLTIVAIGTSLPEVAASVVASIRGERDMAVGNVVGSNLFNIMSVLGLSALLAPAGIPISDGALRLDIPVMIAAALACLPIFFTGHRIDRWEGGLFLGYYLAYTVYLILTATNSSLTRSFALIMLVFVIPLTVVTLGIGLVRAMRK